MGYSRYVGRVGGLAVVLGVGLAFGSGQGTGVAHADGMSDGSTASSAPASPAKHPLHLAQVLHHLFDGGHADTSTATTTPAASTDNTRTEGAHRATALTSKPSTSSLFAAPRHLRPEAGATTSAAETQSTDSQPQATGLANVFKHRPTETTARLVAHEPVSAPDAVTTAQPAQLQAAPLAITPTLQRQPVHLVAAVLSAFGIGHLAPPSPTLPPVQPVVGWTLLGWVRREIEHTFFNKTPTLAPKQTSLVTDASGEIHGTLGATDADGDTLTYTAGAAEHGTVSIDQTAGTWTYTPTAGYVGTDSFTVTASDESSGFHLHGLAGLFEPDGGHTATAAVAVSVATPAAVLGDVDLPGTPIGQPVFSPDGRYAYQATGGGIADDESSNLLIVDTQTGEMEATKHFEGVQLVDGQGLIPTADGKHALLVAVEPGPNTTSGHTDVYYVDLTDPSADPTVISVAGRQDSASHLVLSTDGKHAYLVTSGADDLPSSPGLQPATWVADIDMATGQLVGPQVEIAGLPFGHIAQTANGRVLLSVRPETGPDLPAKVVVIDSQTGQFVGAPVQLPNGTPGDFITVSDDGTRALAETFSSIPGVPNTATLINTDNATVVTALDDLGPTDEVFFEGDGSVLDVTREIPNGEKISVINARTGTESTPIELDGDVRDVESSSDGTVWYQTSPAPNLTVITAVDPTGHATATPITGKYFQFTKNATGSLNYVTTYDDTTKTTSVTVLNGQTNAVERTITLAGTPHIVVHTSSLATSPDNTRGLQFTTVDNPDGSTTAQVTEIDLTTGRVVGSTRTLGADAGATVSFAPDGSKAGIVMEPDAGGNDSAYVLDTATGRLSQPIALGAPGTVTATRISDDGQREFIYLNHASDSTASVAVVDLAHPGLIGQTAVHPGQLVTDKTGTVAVVQSNADAQLDAYVTIIGGNGKSTSLKYVDAGDVYTTFSDDGSRVYIEVIQAQPPGTISPEKTLLDVYGISDTGPVPLSTQLLSFATRGPVILDPNGSRALIETGGFLSFFGEIYVLDTGQASTTEIV